MIDATTELQTERVFAQPDEQGGFAEVDCDRYPIGGFDAALLLVEREDGWSGGFTAKLPDAEEIRTPIACAPMDTCSDALEIACEALIAWCGEQKERGGKKHKAQAEKLQTAVIVYERDLASSDEATGTADDAIPAPAVDAIRDHLIVERLHPGTIIIDPASLSARTNSPAPTLLPLSEIHESPLNPRKIYSEEGLAELAASMRAEGFRTWQPIIARPRAEGGVEAAAGHRRLRAATLAGLSHAPCVVRAMSDEEFTDILYFDNGGREDVHILHEAAGWVEWLKQPGRTVQMIADRIGRSKEYVYKRRLVAGMIPEAQTAFLANEITLGHAELIARGKTDRDQQRILQACYPPEWNKAAGMLSTRDLKEWIDKNLHLNLRGACFPLASAELLPEAGSCDACPHRVGNLPDYNPLEDLPLMCTQPACFEQKVAAHIEAEKKRLTEQGELILLSATHNPLVSGALPCGEWHRAPASDPASKEGLVVDGSQAGTVLRVVLQTRLPLAFEPEKEDEPELEDFNPETPARAAKSAKPETTKADADTKAAQERESQRLKREAARRDQAEAEAKALTARELAVRQKVLAAILDKTEWPPSREGVARLLTDWMGEMLEPLDDLVRAQGVDPQLGARDWAEVSLQHLSRLVTITLVSDDFDEFNITRASKHLDAEAKRRGLDIQAIRKRETLEYMAQASGIDFDSNKIEFKPGKTVLAEIEFREERGGWFVRTGIHLPVKASEGYGYSGPLRPGKSPLAEAVWKDRGAAFDEAFGEMAEFLSGVKSYRPATEATRSAADQVARWVKSGQAARAAMRELNPPKVDPRKTAIANLPAMSSPAAPAKKAPVKKAVPAKKAAPVKAKPVKKSAAVKVAEAAKKSIKKRQRDLLDAKKKAGKK